MFNQSLFSLSQLRQNKNVNVHDRETLKLFLKVQTLAFQAAYAAHKELKPGITEIEAARIMEEFLKKEGVEQFFHRPFAWFGERTAFQGFSRPLPFLHWKNRAFPLLKELVVPNLAKPIPHFGVEFLPTNRKLKDGEAIILDVAPTIHGAAADIGYSCMLHETPKFLAAKKDLEILKNGILQSVKSGDSLGLCYQKIDQQLKAMGYENCHQMYPLGVLGHRVGFLPHLRFPRINILGFHPQAIFFLLQEQGNPFIEENVNDPFYPGLWSFEPHLGVKENGQTYGVKFEEMMVVPEDTSQSYWLSTLVP